MDKKESLEFLRDFREKINDYSEEEILILQKIYDENCEELLTDDNFEFVIST
ncbi:MAG: hypothetical protein LBM02_07880 [Lachnospiraceae bacterium]|jgi:hypothetical protein|nr:hypothetical protein [Lachnospiraceae bacterium]